MNALTRKQRELIERENRILEVSRPMVIREGYHGLNMDRIAEALEDLVKIHPQAASTFEFGVTNDWALDRHAGGIGPLFRPLEMTSRFYDDVVRPVGRVWFANDACDRRARRWIEGAIAAGVRNAWAIHAGLRNELPPTTDLG